MTRGRKKDLSIPPTRALVQQRDYRARKAHYITELERRARKAEEENVQLRQDLEATRARLDIPATLLDPQVADASRDLMQHLSLAMNSLTRFQQLAFPERPQPPVPPSPRLPPLSSLPPHSQLTPFSSLTPPPSLSVTAARISSPTEAQSPSTASVPSPSLTPSAVYPPGRKRLYREDSPEPPAPSRFKRQQSLPFDPSKQSPNSEPECCGGIFDCQDIIEGQEVNEGTAQPSGRLSAVHVDSESPPYDQDGRF